MIVYLDQNGNIHDVEENKTGDSTLQRVEILDEDNPFKNWSKSKICAYRCAVNNGHVVMMTPRIDSRLLETVDYLGKATEIITPYKVTKTAYIGDTSVTFTDTPQGNLTVYFPYPYTVERMADRITVSFEELEEVTEITISIL